MNITLMEDYRGLVPNVSIIRNVLCIKKGHWVVDVTFLSGIKTCYYGINVDKIKIDKKPKYIAGGVEVDPAYFSSMLVTA